LAYQEFMQAYSTLDQYTSDENWTITNERVALALKGVEMWMFAKSYGHSWTRFIEAMLDAYQPGVSELPATAPNTSALDARSSLAIQMALAPSAYLSGGARDAADAIGQIILSPGRPAASAAEASVPLTYGLSSARGGVLSIPQASPSSLNAQLAQSLSGRTPEVARLKSALPRTPMTVGLVAAARCAQQQPA
jgi:hypothetical protein